MHLAKKISISLIVSVSALISGCASIVSDSQYPITINSNPGGASFEIKNKEGKIVSLGKTPAIVHLKSGSGYFASASYSLEIKKPGYESTIIPIESKFDGWYVGNLLFGGVIGFLVVDPLTGAMWKLPKQTMASLEKTEQYNKQDQKILEVITLNEVPKDEQKQLIKLS